MNIYSRTLDIASREKTEILDITPQLKSEISLSKIMNGLVTVTSRHTTTALLVNEYASRLLDDIKSFFGKLVPADKKYLHNDIHLRDCPPDEPENAHSHLIAMLLNNCEIIPLVDGKLMLGQWQSVMMVELDGPRNRTLQLQIIGNN